MSSDTDLQDLSPQRRELYFFTLYRVFEAGLLAMVAFSPLGSLVTWIQEPNIFRAAAVLYLLASLALLLIGRRQERRLRRQAAAGLCLDLSVAAVTMFTQEGAETAIALLLMFNVGAGGLILTRSAALGFASVAVTVVFGEYIFNRMFQPELAGPVAQTVMFSVTYLATAVLTNLLSQQMTESEALAQERGRELADLTQVSELIIRRMRIGVLVVDREFRIQVCNEAAWELMGKPSPDQRLLSSVAPGLHEALTHWRDGRGEVPRALTLAEGLPEVLPRFVPLGVRDSQFLIFLEDSRIYSSRAEELTLATLGRLSASIAHEIRNPLAAISYSAQLLAESDAIPYHDRRLLEIINNQCHRMNGIVQNILGLARRERSQPVSVDLVAFVQRFVEDYRGSHPMESDKLHTRLEGDTCFAMVDPQHLQQVLTVLVHNALTHGRYPGTPADVTVIVERTPLGEPPQLIVRDRGPGISGKALEHLFTPFFTTAEHGTGLGLYIARQLCEANQCTLRYDPPPGGGGAFRISLPAIKVLRSGAATTAR